MYLQVVIHNSHYRPNKKGNEWKLVCGPRCDRNEKMAGKWSRKRYKWLDVSNLFEQRSSRHIIKLIILENSGFYAGEFKPRMSHIIRSRVNLIGSFKIGYYSIRNGAISQLRSLLNEKMAGLYACRYLARI